MRNHELLTVLTLFLNYTFFISEMTYFDDKLFKQKYTYHIFTFLY